MNKKKLLALLMALVMTLTLVPVTALAEEEQMISDGFYKDSTGNNYYIYNAAGLAAWHDFLAQSSTGGTQTRTFHISNDIDADGYVWTPVDAHQDANQRFGTIDGHNHTISNMTVNGAAMFRRFATGCNITIRDITFDNVDVTTTDGINASILTVQTYDNLTLDNVDARNCDIRGLYKVAALVGTVYDENPSRSIGLVMNNCDVSNCTVTSTAYDYMTCGLVAFVYTDDAETVSFENCTISDTNLYAENPNGYTVHAFVYAEEDVTGRYFDTANGVTVTNCYYQPYEIVYNLNGGVNAASNPTKYSSDGRINVILADPTREGFVFEGWVDEYSEEAEKNVSINNNPGYGVENLVYEAKWTEALTSNVAEINGQGYPTLAAAIAAVPANTETTIQLIGDISDMTTAEVAANQNITLDLNGHSIATAVNSGSGTATRHYYAIDNYGKFTLKDSVGTGKIEARGIENLENGVMTIDGAKIVAIDANGGAAIWNEATLEFKSGTLEATYSGAAVGNAGPGCLNNRGTAHIYSGTFTDASVRCYAICNFGDLTIEDATVSGVHGALTCDTGTLVVNGGSYTASNYYGLWITNDGNRTDVTVNGGNFQGGATGRNAIRASVDDGKQDVSDATIRITGGTFTGYGTSAAAVAMNKSNSAHSWGMAISGGTFSTEPDESYIAEGYAAVASGEVWIVKPVVTTSNDNAAVVDTKLTNTIDDSKVNNTNITSETTNVSGVKLSTDATVDSTNSGTADKSGLQAVVDAAKAGNNTLNSTSAGDAIAAASTIEVTVDVKVTPEIFVENQTATFDLTPTATVVTKNDQGNETATISGITVTNDMIDQMQDITVNLYTGFPPVQIIHRDDTGAVIEVFTGNQIGYNANTGVATVTIHHFSELEATGPVAQIGGTPYNTLEAAFAAVQDGETITLLNNVALTDRLFVNAGTTPAYAGANNRYATTSEDKSITLDMNGHNIDSSSNIALAGGSLNIVNNSDPVVGGKISTSASGLAPVEIRGTGNLENKRTLTIGSGVTLDGEEYGLNVFGSNNAQKNLIDVNVNGTVNGTLFVLGNLTNTDNEINIKVNGKIDGGSEEVGIALNGYGNVTVNNGANVSGKTGIEVRAGELTVNGGTITGTGAYAAPTHNGSGTTSSGAAVAVAQHSTKLPIDVTLTGGTLSATGANGKAVVVADPEGNETIADSVQVVATESFKNNSAVDEDYKWVVTSGNNYTLQEKPVKALGGSLRRRATNGGNGNIVYDETDLRFGFTVTDAGHFSTVDSYFTYTFGDYTSGHITATKIANDGTTNLVLTKVPANYFSTEITVTLHAFNKSGELIGTATLTKSVKEVAYALRDGGENISQTWKNYAGTIISENDLKN